MQLKVPVGEAPSEMATHGCSRPERANLTTRSAWACRAVAAQQRRREVSVDFDPRRTDDPRDDDHRDDGRREESARELNQGSRGVSSDPLERDARDPREVFTRDLDLPRGPDRERVWFREHSVLLRGSESRALATSERGGHRGEVPAPARRRLRTGPQVRGDHARRQRRRGPALAQCAAWSSTFGKSSSAASTACSVPR